MTESPPRTILEIIDDPAISPRDKAKAVMNWTIRETKGQVVQSTVHYSGEDIDEFAVPLQMFDITQKELEDLLNDGE